MKTEAQIIRGIHQGVSQSDYETCLRIETGTLSPIPSLKTRLWNSALLEATLFWTFLCVLSCLHICISVKELCRSLKMQTLPMTLLLCCSLETQFCFQVQNERLSSSCTQLPDAPRAFWGAARFLRWERGISSFQSIKSLSTPQSIPGYCIQPLRKLKKMWNMTCLATLYLFSCFAR